jgi:hypothetical protein
MNHHLRLLMDEVFGAENFLNEIAWCYKSGGAGNRGYAKKHDTIYLYAKTKNFYFSPKKEKSYMGEDYSTGNKNVELYNDNDGKGVYTLVNLKDWWIDIGMLATSSKQRCGYPTQKPEKLISRIIESSSKPGDIVFDCFMGSGTTQAAAVKLGRRFIGADINPGAVRTTVKRLLGISKKLEKEGDTCPGFEVYHINSRGSFGSPGAGPPAGESPVPLETEAESTAEVMRSRDKLVIRKFHPGNLIEKTGLQGEKARDWKRLVESVMIDFNYDGAVLCPDIADIPPQGELIRGEYDIPPGAGRIRVKITDLLSESLELDVP